MSEFTHLNSDGKARMVDVSDKGITKRIATASGDVLVGEKIMEMIKDKTIPKGDVLTTAKIAGIMSAKNTSSIIPMCHPVKITGIDISFNLNKDNITVTATVSADDKTGVEMEAITAVSVVCITIYDMCKSVDKGIIILNIRLLKKSGGKSGDFSA